MTQLKAEKLTGTSIMIVKKTGRRGGISYCAMATKQDECPHCRGWIPMEFRGFGRTHGEALAALVKVWFA